MLRWDGTHFTFVAGADNAFAHREMAVHRLLRVDLRDNAALFHLLLTDPVDGRGGWAPIRLSRGVRGDQVTGIAYGRGRLVVG